MNDLQFLFYNSKCEIKYFIFTFTHKTKEMLKIKTIQARIGIRVNGARFVKQIPKHQGKIKPIEKVW